MTNNIIIGTAGHIDHGKTTLIRALTGRETDTLAEEKKRGISINLGFTWFDLPGGRRAGIIDVPGHERFIKNMIAGASGIDIVLLVIAATEGIMPQTTEHMDVLSFLGIKRGVVALTKCGMAERDMIDMIRDDVRQAVKGGFLEDAEIVEVDSVSGQGLLELALALDRAGAAETERKTAAPTRLNIDRCFSVKGFGAVVTGTLIEGRIALGDTLTLYPSEQNARIRGIQVHESPVTEALAGQRTALNIQNLKAEDMRRGDVLAAPGSMAISDKLDVRISLLAGSRDIRMWERLRLYTGARELLCRLVPLDSEGLPSGTKDAICQLRLEEPLCAKKGDCFVLRFYSPMETVGGGVVLDANPGRHSRFSEEAIAALRALDSGSLPDMAEGVLRAANGLPVSRDKLRQDLSLSEEAADGVLSELCDNGRAIKLDSGYADSESVNTLIDSLLGFLSDYHAANALKPGLSRDELRSRIKTQLGRRDFDLVLEKAEIEGLIELKRQTVCLKGFAIALDSAQRKIHDKIVSELEKNAFTATEVKLAAPDKKSQGILALLIPDTALRLGEAHIIGRVFYERAKDAAADMIRKNGSVTVGEFRDSLKVSRKFAMLLLDEMDRERFTRRVEDTRVLV